MSPETAPTVLITGANGFVGSRLCRRFLNDGFEVIAGIRKGCDLSLIEDLGLPCRYGDVTCLDALPDMVAEVDYIIHNAGLTRARKPDQFDLVNRIGTKNMIEAALGNPRLKKFVYISSLAAAGPSRLNRPLTENDRPQPITGYGRSKLAGEGEILSSAEKLNAVIIRPPGVYGPGDKEMFSFFKIVNWRILPYLGDLKRKIQLVYVDDLCRGISLALTSQTRPGAVYFIAEATGYTYRELVDHLRRAVGKAGFPLYLPGGIIRALAFISEKAVRGFGGSPMFTVEKANEILESWEVSIDRARAELGYYSGVSFPEGARITAEWYRDKGWF